MSPSLFSSSSKCTASDNSLLSSLAFHGPASGSWHNFRGCWRALEEEALVLKSFHLPIGTWYHPWAASLQTQGWLREAPSHWQVPGQLCGVALQKADSRGSHWCNTEVNVSVGHTTSSPVRGGPQPLGWRAWDPPPDLLLPWRPCYSYMLAFSLPMVANLSLFIIHLPVQLLCGFCLRIAPWNRNTEMLHGRLLLRGRYLKKKQFF